MDREEYLKILRKRLAKIIKVVSEVTGGLKDQDPELRSFFAVKYGVFQFFVSSKLTIQWRSNTGLKGDRVHIWIFILTQDRELHKKLYDALKALGIPNLHLRKPNQEEN